MRIQPQHHDGEGTNASLNDFLNGGGIARVPTIIGIDRAGASRDIGATVQRLRDRGIAPPRVDGHRSRLTNMLMLAAAIGLILWVAFALIRAWLAGRL